MGCKRLNTDFFTFLEIVHSKKSAPEEKKRINYYPFGLKHKGYNNIVSSNGNSTAQKIKFGGKEYQDELGLEWYDVSARNYDPALGRWMNLDPLAELMTRHSPYNYAFDNPIYFIDADGMMPIGMMSTGIDNPEDFNPSEFDDRNKDFNPKDLFRPTVFANASGSNNNNGPSDPDPPVVYNGPGVAVGDNVVNLLDEVVIGTDSESGFSSRAGSAATVGGAAYYGLEKTMVNGGRWLGKNGKYYSITWGEGMVLQQVDQEHLKRQEHLK